VTIGGIPATSVVVVSSSQITAVTPAHAAGAVNVVVTNSDNQSGTLANGFTYTAPAPNPAPTVSAVSPTAGSTDGGTAVTITGTGFLSGAVVEFGGILATNVVVVNSTSITATTPPHTAGSVDVIVTNTDSQSGTLTGGFVYSLPSSAETILLQDNFNDNSLDLSKWNKQNLFSGFIDTSIPATETNQRIEFGPLLSNASGSHYVGMRSVNSFNFNGAYCYVELVQAAASNTSADAMFTLGKDANNYYRIFVEGGTIIGQKRINGGSKVSLFTAAYDPANDRYWRIRHDSTTGKVIFETAPDNGGSPGSWTVRSNEAWNTSAIPLSSVLFEIKGGTWQAESNAPGTVIFDNFKAAKP
jgi:hypothetical protein